MRASAQMQNKYLQKHLHLGAVPHEPQQSLGIGYTRRHYDFGRGLRVESSFSK
jgi:hypothetical protein